MAEEIQEQTPSPQLSPEDQKALDRARGTTTTTSPYNEDGSLVNEPFEIPEKFQGKSLEDIVKSYTELEKKLSEKPVVSPDVKEGDDTTKTKEVEAKVNETLTPDSFKKYEEAYISQGSLSEEHYSELADKGLSKEVVDLYIEGAKARESIYTNSIYDSAGGKEQFESLVQWASENITDTSVIEALNKDLSSGNVAKAKWAVETLQLRRGTPPRRLEGDSGTDLGGMKTYRDKSEWKKDVGNALYGKDRKYTQIVDAKYLASKKKGTL